MPLGDTDLYYLFYFLHKFWCKKFPHTLGWCILSEPLLCQCVATVNMLYAEVGTVCLLFHGK